MRKKGHYMTTHPEHNTKHGACGKTWRQRGSTTGHCAGCHETFEGITLFDAHFTRDDEKLACKNPNEMEHPRGFKLIEINGAWRSTKPHPKALESRAVSARDDD